MSKYYYDCAIEAAYMAKNFGIKIQLWNRDVDTGETTYHDLENEKTILGAYGFPIRLLVHPDSVVSLEPIKDDVVDTDRCGFGFVTEREENNINVALFQPNEGIFKDGYWFRRWIKIVSRGGKSFIMPKEVKDE